MTYNKIRNKQFKTLINLKFDFLGLKKIFSDQFSCLSLTATGLTFTTFLQLLHAMHC